MAIMEFLFILLVFAIGSRGFVLEDKTKIPGIFKSSDIMLIKPVTISPKFNLNLPNSLVPGNRIDINFNSFKNNLLSGKLVRTNLFKKSDDDLTIVDMINSSTEPSSIEPIIAKILIKQTTQNESPNKTRKETLTHLESERNLQNSAYIHIDMINSSTEPTSIEPIIAEIPMEQNTRKESLNKTTKETLTHLESERNLQNSAYIHIDMINSSTEPTSIEPIIAEVPMEQNTKKESLNKTPKETITHLESEKNLQNSEPNIKVKKWIVDHQEIPNDNMLELGESSDKIKGVLSRTQNEIDQPASIIRLTTTKEPQPKVVKIVVENLQQIHQISQEPNLGIQNESIIDAKDETGIINFINNDIEADTEKFKELPTTDAFRSMELITESSIKLTKINSAPEILQNIEPKSNIQRNEKIHSFSDIISNTLLAIYESQPKTKENKEIKETPTDEEIVGAANPKISSDNLSSEPNYKAKSTKRSISDELNRNQQLMKNFGPTQQPAPRKRQLLEKLENETSAERQERWNKSLQHMMTAVSVMGQIDKFISGRIKSGVKMVAKMYDEEDDQIRSRRNSFF